MNNILFKFAVASNEIFSSDYAAMKMAGNELKGLLCYFNCSISQLNFPLMALVDYMGLRLVAMSVCIFFPFPSFSPSFSSFPSSLCCVWGKQKTERRKVAAD